MGEDAAAAVGRTQHSQENGPPVKPSEFMGESAVAYGRVMEALFAPPEKTAELVLMPGNRSVC